MNRVIKAAVAAVASIALLAALPSGASAGESCIFQNEKVDGKNQTKLERSLLCLTNVHRLRNGRPALFLDTRLAAAARSHTEYMVAFNYFDHRTPDNVGPSERAAAFGYPGGAGENIATNTEGTVFRLFDQWRSSVGHNNNMLALYKAAGMGVARGCCPGGSDGATGTQNFGNTPANTQDDALDFYASSNRCAKLKIKLYNLQQKSVKNKRQKKKRLRKKIRKRCDPPV